MTRHQAAAETLKIRRAVETLKGAALNLTEQAIFKSCRDWGQSDPTDIFHKINEVSRGR